MLAPPSDLRQMHFLTIDAPDSNADLPPRQAGETASRENPSS